jgi:radical SAM superfamily enzyme YgiQ (UPF0313 family)
MLLAYPGTYAEGMSSLGYLTVLRMVEERPGWCIERVFLDEGDDSPRSLATGRPAGDFPVVAFSVGYELQVPAVARLLIRAGIEPLASKRPDGRPLVVAGGPLTRINPRPLGAFSDVVAMGDSEQTLPDLLRSLEEASDLKEAAHGLADTEGFYVPAVHGENVPEPRNAPADMLPAYASIVTPGSALSDMFLVEAARGCPHGCLFCTMRRDRSGGARWVDEARILDLLPEDTRRVGLVGAAACLHPGLKKMLSTLASRGAEVGLSSVRADAVDRELTELLAAVKLRTLTMAADGASQRLRDAVSKGVSADQLLAGAKWSAVAGLKKLKLYQLVGLPGETDVDIQEMVSLCNEMASHLPLELVVGPLVPKPSTPMDTHEMVPAKELDRRIGLARSLLLRHKVAVKQSSTRWAAVEWRIAFGGLETGRRILDALSDGGSYRAFRNHLEDPRSGGVNP